MHYVHTRTETGYTAELNYMYVYQSDKHNFKVILATSNSKMKKETKNIKQLTSIGQVDQVELSASLTASSH